MLIIIENCQGMIEESKQEFNEALKKLAEEPHKIKIIVVTQ
jgi:vacuolar-type H+-ATPase subunit F/Vma7